MYTDILTGLFNFQQFSVGIFNVNRATSRENLSLGFATS